MKPNRGHISRWWLLAPSVLLALALLACSYLGYVSPGVCGLAALPPFAFPVVWIVSVLWLGLLVLCGQWRQSLVPFAALVAAGPAALTYCPVNSVGTETDTPGAALTVMTYNTYGWAQGDTAIAEYIVSAGYDIVAPQESAPEAPSAEIVRRAYAYSDTVHVAGTVCVPMLFSRYPIVRHEAIAFPANATNTNGAAAFWVDVRGRQVIVVNAYFQITGLSPEVRRGWREMLHGEKERDSLRASMEPVVRAIVRSSRVRSAQVDAVARFIERHAGEALIVLGDFNDSPLSYTHQRLVRHLSDAYVDAARGPGYTYRSNAIRQRIDNVLYTPASFRAAWCAVLPAGSLSDHQPVGARLEMVSRQRR